jgi:hypothetical protein
VRPAALLLALLATADLEAGPANAAAPRPLLLGTFACVAPSETSAGESSLEAWRKQLDEARARRRSGKVLTLVGAAVLIAANAIHASSASYPDFESEAQKWSVVGASAAGFGIGAVGFVRWKSASSDIGELEATGRTKGYGVASRSRPLVLRLALRF